jgi:hypothetical protein
VHYDVRQYETNYLDDRHFVRSLEEMDRELPIAIL